jgi:hypothetical protein
MNRVLLATAMMLLAAASADAQTTIPPTAAVHADDFDSGSLDDWFLSGTGTLGLEPGQGLGGSTALAITVTDDEAHLIRGNRRDVARADEAYLTFSLDPDGVDLNDPGSGFIPNRSVQVGVIRGPEEGVLVALRMREIAPGNYEGFLQWLDGSASEQYDFLSGSFPLTDGWQEVTIGFRGDDWVACWIDGNLVRSVTGVNHFEPYASWIEVGKANSPPLLPSPTGRLLFDDVDIAIPMVSDLWVDAGAGDDSNDGLTPGTAFKSVARASDLAGAGTVVHIQPGLYYEAVVPAQGGLAGNPVTYRAESGPGTVFVRGSEPSAGLAWTQLANDSIGLPPGVDPDNIWWTDLSSWELQDSPQAVVHTSATGEIEGRLLPAREPDWEPGPAHRYSEYWWRAQGGASLPACDPATDNDNECDLASRSTLQLIDAASETTPAGIEAGNLTTLGSLVGATLVARETFWAHRLFTRKIVAHNVGAGQVTVDLEASEADGDPGLGWGTQYYVENHPALIDSPGEWWYDAATGRLYLWPIEPGDPGTQHLEITRADHAFDLADRSYLALEDLDLQLFNGPIIEVKNLTWLSSRDLAISGCSLSYGEKGILLSQTVEAGEHTDKTTEGIVIDGNHFSNIDHDAIRSTANWDNGNDPDSWVRLASTDITISGNTLTDIGFRPPFGTAGATGAIWIWWGDDVTLEGNHISSTAQEGVKIYRSVIQSPDTWGFSPDEIKTGKILIKDNLIEQACLLKNDCGALLVEGIAFDQHVLREVLVMGNTLREVFGWSWVAEQRGLWGEGQLPGGGGIGLYIGGAANVHIYRNIFYSNAFAGIHLAETWRDGEIYIYNNTSTDHTYGLHFGGLNRDTHDDFDTRVGNNLFVNNEAHGVKLSNLESTYPNTVLDHNLYFNNGWRDAVTEPGALRIAHDGSSDFFPTVAEIVAGTPFEDAGQAADPGFLDYDLADHSLIDGSRPDFRLLAGSAAVDAGTTSLPPALADLLTLFGIVDPPQGPAYDQGAIEGTVECGDLTIDEAVNDARTFQTCGTLTFGSNFEVTFSGSVTASAGRLVVFMNGATVAEAGTLTAEDGVFLP